MRLLVLLVVFLCGFVLAASVGAHVYRGNHAGLVLWACGPGIEVVGHPSLIVDHC
jgi:hypothetical protein